MSVPLTMSHMVTETLRPVSAPARFAHTSKPSCLPSGPEKPKKILTVGLSLTLMSSSALPISHNLA